MAPRTSMGLFASTALASVAAALMAAPAFAQQTTSQGPAAPATTGTANSAVAPAATEDTAGLQEIVVTAQRRTENLQRVPLSVVAVGADQIKQNGLQTIESLNRIAPDVVIERVGLFPGAASLSMRGVGYSGIESFTDPDVAVYVNGIYQARNATALSQTLDVQSIEVLRGPQGTLFGRNAFAGAISLQTARPDMHETTGSATATIGNDGLVDLDVVGNVPIVSDVLAARVAIRSHNLSGLWHNNGITATGAIDPSLVGKRIGREKSLIVRPSIRFTPNDKLDIQFIAEISRERDQAAPILSLPIAGGSTIQSYGGWQANPFGDQRAGIPGDGSNPYVTGYSLNGRPMNFTTNNFTLDASYDTGVGKLRFLGNYQNTKSDVWVDTDGSVANIFSSDRLENYHAYSGELQYVSNFSDKLSVIAGALAFHDRYKTTQLSFTNFGTNAPAVFNQTSYLSPTSATCFGNQTTTVTTGCTYPKYTVSYINNGGKRTAYAAYLQTEYHITDPLSIVLGVRYSYEKKYDYYGSNSTLAQTGLPLTVDPALHLLPVSNFLPNGTPLIYRAAPYKNHNWSPRVGVNYKLSNDILLFAFWQRAYKSGGFNANAADLTAFQNPYGPEKVDNFEGGIKSEFFDHKLRVNLNGFYGKYSNLQRSQVTASPTAPSGVTTVTSNTSDLISYGVEAEVAYKPQPTLTLFTNLAWDKAYYTRYCADLNGAEASPTPTLAPTLAVCGPTTTVTTSTGGTAYLVPQDYSHNRPLRAPRWDITWGFIKDFLIGTGKLTTSATANYRSSEDTDLLNRPYSFRPAMVTVDGSIRWAPESGRYSISLWGRNLTNNIKILGYTPVSSIFAFGSPTPPRQYGATLNVNF